MGCLFIENKGEVCVKRKNTDMSAAAASKDLKACRDYKDHRDYKAFQEHKVSQDKMVSKDLKVYKDHKAYAIQKIAMDITSAANRT
jgi:hypothetical protein